jgi:hypothetical protein
MSIDIEYFCSDLGNHERFVATYGNNLRYIQETGDWLLWSDDEGWQKVEESCVYALADQVAKAIYDEAKDAPSSSREKLTYHALRSQ